MGIGEYFIGTSKVLHGLYSYAIEKKISLIEFPHNCWHMKKIPVFRA
jgi:hypothetical protein